MGVCPNCGSWVEDGDACGVCGGGGSYDYNQKKDDSFHVRNDSDEKINRARYIINSEMSDDNANLQRAMGILNQTRDEIDDCLRQGNVREQVSLRCLQIEIDELKEKIRIKMDRNDKQDKGRPRKNSVKIMVSNIEFGDQLPIFKLVKRDEGQIAVYQGNNEIGFVSNDLKPNESWPYANASELTYLPEISYAQLLFYENNPDNHDFPRLVSANLLDDSQAKELQELQSYPKEKLITIAGTEFFNYHELRKGMKLKLVKEPDNIHDKDAIAVYLGDSQIGYVANSQKTSCSFTLMASQLKDIPAVSYAEYLQFYNGTRHIAVRKG